MATFRPLHDRVLVRRVDPATQTTGGLFLPDSAKEKPQRAQVIAIGAGKRNDEGNLIALTVKVGDEILFGKYAGSEIKLDGDDHIILREDEILAIID